MKMNKKYGRFKTFIWLILFGLGLFMISAIILSGCTDTLKGDENENIIPLVSFVNIPPEDFSFSHNPEIYWYGTDPDGQIDYYRFAVRTLVAFENSGLSTPVEYAASLHDTMWTYVDVDPSQANPQTAYVVPLTADTLDPVVNFVDQYVFIQAYDNDGDGSLIAVRRFNRNDHPPQTLLWNISDTPFVNSPDTGGIITGVRLHWEGSDEVDYDQQGLIPPPFEFEWRLFGPFTSEELSQLTSYYYYYDEEEDPVLVLGSATQVVAITNDGVIHYEDEEIEFCDESLDDNGDPVVNCTLIVLDSATLAGNSTVYYEIDTLIDVNIPEFQDKLVAHSWDGIDEWVYDTQDTVYNVFRNYDAGGVTVAREFLFWVRCRDDAHVMDPTPDYAMVPVVDPKYERDILVLDFTATNLPIVALKTHGYGDPGNIKRLTFWKELIEEWGSDRGLEFDTTDEDLAGDIILLNEMLGLSLHKLLQYKVMIIVDDALQPSGLTLSSQLAPKGELVLTAVDAGVNAWVTARSFFAFAFGYLSEPPDVPRQITDYFGVGGSFYTNWCAWSYGGDFPGNMDTVLRIEDFCGAASLDETRWPSVTVDTARLHDRYYFEDDVNPSIHKYISHEWIPEIAALPEVGWCQRMYGTEPMYLYESIYGADHFLGYPYAISGTPVAHRLETNLYRTVWFQFTLPSLAFEADGGVQGLTNSVLDWLYDPNLEVSGVTSKRYPNADVKISIDDARAAYDARLSE
jgi:hypothetical protein